MMKKEEKDTLPELTNLADVWGCIPPLAPPIIDGVLRQGHKMLLSAPSKAGKSFGLIELALSFCSGRKWFGQQCHKSKVLYINLEIDRPSFIRRMTTVGQAMNISKADIYENIWVWNLRGKGKPMDKLVTCIINHVEKSGKDIQVIIVDPIYKVLTGNENKAYDMSKFCNYFERVAEELHCAIVCCHHHSKGAQGGKAVIDRSSGSGVLGRDFDALVDMTELPIDPKRRDELETNAGLCIFQSYLDEELPEWEEEISDKNSIEELRGLCEKHFTEESNAIIENEYSKAVHRSHIMTAWRIECVLREFPKPDPWELFFSYPIHKLDDSGLLKRVRPDVVLRGRTIHQREKAESKETKDLRNRQAVQAAYEAIAAHKPMLNGVKFIKLNDFVEVSEEFFSKNLKRDAMRNRIEATGSYVIQNGMVFPIIMGIDITN